MPSGHGRGVRGNSGWPSMAPTSSVMRRYARCRNGPTTLASCGLSSIQRVEAEEWVAHLPATRWSKRCVPDIKLVVELDADLENALAMFSSLGFVCEALLRDHIRDRDGEFHDLVMLAHFVDGTWAGMDAIG